MIIGLPLLFVDLKDGSSFVGHGEAAGVDYAGETPATIRHDCGLSDPSQGALWA